jgi:leucyl-tRNA synthetase
VEPYAGEGDLPKPLADLHRKTHQTIKKVTEDLRDRFHFNTAIAAVMELVNLIYQVMESAPRDKLFWRVIRESIDALVLMVSPVVPHIAEELWQALGHRNSLAKVSWPEWREDALLAEEILIVVQVNGKLRSRITVAADATKQEIEKAALQDPRIQEFISGKTIKKIVVVPGKLVNIVF